jgi:hypothetical protein
VVCIEVDGRQFSVCDLPVDKAATVLSMLVFGEFEQALPDPAATMGRVHSQV